MIASACSHSARKAALILTTIALWGSHPTRSYAQTSRVAAAFEGTVKDSSSAVIPGASVVIRNTSTNQTRTAQTDAEGAFHVPALPVGAYEVRVDQSGFAPYKLAEVDLFLGQTARLDIVLVPASSTEKLTVTAQAETLDTTQTSVVSSVDGGSARNSPR